MNPRQWSPFESVVLASIARSPAYGYEIAQRVELDGFGEVQGGTLYPLLRRLESSGFIEGLWQPGKSGPRRRYYQITSSGEEELAVRRTQWKILRSGVDRALGVRE